MAIAEREAFEQRLIKHDACRGIDGGDAVFFVDRLAQHDPPPSLALFQKIIEAAGANNVGQLALDLAALRNRHLGLRDRPRTGKVDGDATEEVQNAHTFVPTFLRDADELLKRALKPGCHHDAVGMPDRPETLPVTGVAPNHPIFQELPDFPAIIASRGCRVTHGPLPLFPGAQAAGALWAAVAA